MCTGKDIFTNNRAIAENFNSVFVFVNAAKSNATAQPKQGSTRFCKLREFVVNSASKSGPFEISLITTEFVYKQLIILDEHKAKSIDNIGPYFLKLAAEIISRN